MMSVMRQKALQAAEGKTDLLLRFFESSFFDEWIALVYLYQNQGPGVHDYLCNKLYELPEHSLEKYLLQFVYLAVSRPGSALERVIIDYCSKSFRVAVKVYWLLLAITQDQPKNRHVDSLKEACEKAALEGRWEVPFLNPTLDPLSPAHASDRTWSPPLAVHSTDSLAVLPNCPPRDADAWAELPHFLGQGVEEVLCMQPFHTKDKLHAQLQLHDVPERSSGSLNERCHDLRLQLGEGEGVTALLAKSRHSAATGGPGCVSAHYADDDRSPTCDRPVSPTTRLRHNTFGATLDFMQELCDASSTLTSITQEQREMALHSALESINQAIETSSKEEMAIWFPMGSGRERILRLTASEAVLLNSREKAPFMLFVEVLKEDEEDDPHPVPVRSASNGTADVRDGPERSAKSWATTRSSSIYADSAKSLLDGSSEATHPISRPSTADPALSPSAPDSPTSAEPPAPPAPAPNAPLPARPPPIVIDTAAISYSDAKPPPAPAPGPQQPPAHPLATGLPPRPRTTPAPTPTTRLLSPKTPFASLASLPSLPDALRASSLLPKSTSESALKHSQAGSQASSGKESGILKGIAQKSIGLARAIKEHASASSASDGPLSNERLAELVSAASNSNAGPAPARPPNPIIKRMDDAMASLRGDAPLVKVHIAVLDQDPFDAAISDSTALADADRRRMAAEAGPSGLRKASSDEAGAGTFKALNLLSKLSLCRKGGFLDGESPHGQRQQRLVSVRFEVAAGVNLPIPSPYRRSRRVPSQDAIDAIADKYHILTIPPPIDIGPPLKRPAPIRPPTIYSPRNPAAPPTDAPAFPEPPSTPDPIAPEPPVPKPPSSRGPSPTPSSILNALPFSNALPPDPSNPASPISAPPSRPSPTSPAAPAPPPTSPTATSTMLRKQREANAVYGERWRERVARIRKESPQGRRKGWALRCAIVKSGDDCRQELLAVQLIRTFHDIFQECGLPLWLRPYEVLVTSNRTALIELIPDCLSIHTVKHRSPPGTSLSDHFFAKFGHGTPQCATAQRKFTESMAAYSIICYILQIKDRHNGNIMLDDEGRVVHIDFGFMLSNSPGGVNFESAPFKLTRELLEVMDSTSEGKPSELFDYFKVLCIQGFLAARKHSDRIVQLVRMMARSGFPCFKAGDRAVKNLEKRFHLNLTEVQCVQVVLGLISESLDAWRTRQYDYYQRVLNGIL